MRSIYVQTFAALVTGIFLGDKISAGDALIFSCAVVATAPLRKLVFKKMFSVRVLVVLAAVFGIISYHMAFSEERRELNALNDKYITAVGKIVDLPRSENNLNIYVVEVAEAKYLGVEYTPNEKVRVSSEKEFSFGDSVEVKGFLKKFPPKLNNGDFDASRHYKAKGIYFKMFSDEMEFAQKEIKLYSLTYFVTMLKSRISDRIYENYSGDDAAVLKAVFTGYKDGFSEEFEDMLYKTNTVRMFYPTYLHLSIILSFIGMLGSFCKKNIRDKLFIFLLILYSVYNFNSHYILKTSVLAIVLAYTKMKIGYSSYMEALSAVCTAILLVNPLVCYESGFVLSVSAGILIYYFVPPTASRIKLNIKAATKRFIAVWIVMSIGMVPLNAYFFSMTNPYSFLINLLAFPVLGFLWMAVSVNLMIISVIDMQIITKLTLGMVYFIRKLPDILCGLPFFTINLPRPSVVIIIIFYLCLFVLYRRKCRRAKDDFAVSAAGAAIVGLALSCIFAFVSEADDIRINIVNVGQGDGAVVSVPFHETVLIDGGGSSEYSEYDYGKSVYLPFLKRNGYTNIAAAVVTHYHSDHVKGIIAAMKELNINDVIIPDCMENNRYRVEIEELAKEKGIKVSYYTAGNTLKFSSGMEMKIVAPNKEDLQSEDENNRAYGIRLEYGDFSALFMADITAETEFRHLGRWGDCDVLKVGHHGSKTSTSSEFINEAKPETAIISVGENNSYSHPHKEVLETFKENNIKVYRTDLNGNIIVRADKNGEYDVMSFYDVVNIG